MPRRLLAPVLVALALLVGAGCADDVSPAARVGDVTITNEELLDEVAAWNESPTLLATLQLPGPEGGSPGTYSTALADFVLGTRIAFELHNAQFEALGLELSDQILGDVRAGLFEDPTATDAVFAELSRAYGDRLVEEVARQFSVSDAMGDDYQAWATEAFGSPDIEVNPRYGTWDAANGLVRAPEGPAQPAPGA